MIDDDVTQSKQLLNFLCLLPTSKIIKTTKRSTNKANKSYCVGLRSTLRLNSVRSLNHNYSTTSPSYLHPRETERDGKHAGKRGSRDVIEEIVLCALNTERALRFTC